MQVKRRTVAAGATIAALAAGGAGIAYAVGGGDESEERVTGPAAEKAEAAALDSVGGGTVLDSEHDDGDGANGAAYEIEIERPDGSQVEVYVDDEFNALGSAGDDEAPGEDDDAGEDDD